jgi:type VI secretion system protein VasG
MHERPAKERAAKIDCGFPVPVLHYVKCCFPLSDDMIDSITGARLARIRRQLLAGHEAELVIGDGVMDLVRARCTEVESGGRMIDAILTNTLLPELSRGVLNRSIEGVKLARVTVGADAGGFTYTFE